MHISGRRILRTIRLQAVDARVSVLLAGLARLRKALFVSNLQSLIDDYVAKHGSSYRSIAERLEWSHGTISSWFKRGRTYPPSADDLRALAVQIHTPYKKILRATLLDYGYLPEEGQAHGQPPAEKITPPTPIGAPRKTAGNDMAKRAARKKPGRRTD